MATRLYISSTSPSYTPATKRGSWDASSSTLVKELGAKSANSGSNGFGESSGTNNYDVLMGRWVSLPLSSDYTFTTSDTVEWIVGVSESSNSANDYFHVHIFVTAGDSDTVRGTLLSNNIGATEFPTTGTGRGEGTKTLSAVSALAGDHIVVEIGYQAQNTSTTSFTGNIWYGTSGTDLTSGSTNVGSEPGWFEFSPTISFGSIISVSDTITVAEQINHPQLNVSETITVTERVDRFLDRGRIFMSGFELNSTSSGTEFYGIQGTPTIQSTTVRTGTYAMRSNGGDVESLEVKIFDNGDNFGDANKAVKTYYRAYVRVATALNVASGILYLGNRFGQQTAAIQLQTDNTLKLYKRTVQVGSASASLGTGQWHLVELACQVRSATGQIDVEARLDGVVFATQTASTSEANPFGYFRIGVQGGSTAGDIYFDDIAINTDVGGYPGPGSVARVLPNATGDSNQWSSNSYGEPHANNYQDVDEVTPDDGSTYVGGSTEDLIDDYNVGAVSAVSSSSVINWVGVGVRSANALDNGEAAFVARIKNNSEGVVEESGVNLQPRIGWKTIGTNAGYAVPHYLLPIISNVDPEDSAWTSTTLGTMQIGQRISKAAGSDPDDVLQVTNIWAYIDYHNHIQDTITVTENVSIILAPQASLIDTVTVSEFANITKVVDISVIDYIDVSDAFSDEFNGTGLNATKWTVYSGSSGTYTVGSGVFASTTSGDYTELDSYAAYDFDERTLVLNISDLVTSPNQSTAGIGLEQSVGSPFGPDIYARYNSGVWEVTFSSGGSSTTVNPASEPTNLKLVNLSGRWYGSYSTNGGGAYTAVADYAEPEDPTSLFAYVYVQNSAVIDAVYTTRTWATVYTESSTVLVSVSDSVAVTEDVTKVLICELSKSDTVTVTEFTSNSGEVTISVFDSISVSESITLLLVSSISVSDTVAVAENLSITNIYEISVFDAITVVESTTLLLSVNISVFDAVTITEAITVSTVFDISVFDSISVTESITLLLVSSISVSDTVATTEYVATTGQLIISVFDAITLTENIALTLPLGLSVLDQVEVSDGIDNILLFCFVSVNDTVTISEDVNLVMSGAGYFGVSANDTVTVSEALAYVELGPRALKQVYLAGSSANIIGSASPALYNHLMAGFGGVLSWTTTEFTRTGVVPTAGYIDNLHIHLGTAPGGTGVRIFTVMKNGLATSLAVTITGTDSTGSSTSDRVQVAAGDTISLRETHSNNPAASHTAWSADFSSDVSKRYAYYTGAAAVSTTTRDYVDPFVGGAWNTTRTAQEVVVPHTGTIRSLYVELSVAPGVGASRVFSFYINGVEDTSTRVTIADTATTGNVTGLSVSLSAGDTIALSNNPVNTPAASNARWGTAIDSAADGESMIASRSATTLSAGSAEYNLISTNNDTYTTEPSRVATNTTTPFFLKSFRVVLSAAPGATKSRTFRLRKSQANGNEVVTISNSDTSGVDTTNIDVSTIALDDYAISHTPSGTPADATAQWSFTLVVPATISVSDSISATESVNLAKGYSISVNDTVTVSEFVQLTLVQGVGCNDTVTVTEFTNFEGNLIISVFDAVSVTDVLTIGGGQSIFGIDTVTITEVVSFTGQNILSVFDAISVTENVASVIVNTISVFDTVTVSESISTEITKSTSVFDTVTIVENVSFSQSSILSVFDTITVTEFINLTQVFLLSVSDTVTITEVVTLLESVSISVNDSVTVTEGVTVSIVSFVSVFDSVSVAEDISVIRSLAVAVSDQITVSENLAITADIYLLIFELVTITENLAFETLSKISVFDSISLEEFAAAKKALDASCNDTVTLSESVQVTATIGDLSVFDQVTVTEVITLVLSFGINLSDSITVTESSTVYPYFPTSVNDSITVTDRLTGVTLIVTWRGRRSTTGGGSIWTDIDRPIT